MKKNIEVRVGVVVLWGAGVGDGLGERLGCVEGEATGIGDVA
jgi:hypothetical protein